MTHFLEDNDELNRYLSESLFPSFKKAETILFLGAGSSVTELQFLGKEVIQYYEDQLGVQLGTNDLIEFTDIISANPKFLREEFDNYIVQILSKLNPTETHKIIAGIEWNQIITTNVDLIIERAFDAVQGTSQENKKLKPIRNLSETHSHSVSGSIKYSKLNGCISNKSKYPLVFASKDFNDSKKFYNATLKSLADLSPEVKFVTVGYSFSDKVSDYILKHFDQFNFRYKKPIICFDPFIQPGRLDYLKEKGIYVIKLTAEQLFKKYQEWEESAAATIVARKSITFKNSKNEAISIPSKLKLALGSNLVQLTDTSRIPSVPAISFYQGERPTFDVVRKNTDVIKSDKLAEVKAKILTCINKQKENIVPVIFLTGSFGTGKSTFSYRVLNELIKDPSANCVAFEFLDISKIRVQDVGELFSLTGAKTIFITLSEIEVDSAFKELMDFRNKISVEQFSVFNVFFLVSIRENILNRFFKTYRYRNVEEINIDSKINLNEATDLVEKLGTLNLVSYRDAIEKRRLINQICKDFDGDTFISLISMITHSNFEEFIISAYHQLTKTAKEAFIYTSILYQYKILMPVGLLMRLVTKSWPDFEENVLKYDSKGIIIQEYLTDSLSPDLFFRTKHSIISEHLVKKLVKNEDQFYDRVKKIVESLNETDLNAELFVNLIKAIRNEKALSDDKINRIFDLADKRFEYNPHFALHYTVNLQLRKTIASNKKGIEKIRIVESKLDYRNNKLTHRRGCLHYELSKIYHSQNDYPNTIINIEEARELFEIKRLSDPGSSYSYIDYINLELWVLNKLKLEENELLLLHIKIQELFDWADNAVSENLERIERLRFGYRKHLDTASSPSNNSLMEYLDELYEKDETRPYSLVLKYNYFQDREREAEALNLIPELESLSYNNEVAKLLFKYYGRNLNTLENRNKFFKLIKDGYDFRTAEPLRFHFYSYVAESYNRNFNYADEHIQYIFEIDTHFNPDLHELWRDESGQEIMFTGYIYNTQKGFMNLKISDLQLRCRLLKKSFITFSPKPNDQFKVKLHFFLRGIRAEIIEKVN